VQSNGVSFSTCLEFFVPDEPFSDEVNFSPRQKEPERLSAISWMLAARIQPRMPS